MNTTFKVYDSSNKLSCKNKNWTSEGFEVYNDYEKRIEYCSAEEGKMYRNPVRIP